jgi:TolB-like protein/Tfp pilus assembly protein PilF
VLYRFGSCTFDTTRRELSREQRQIDVEPQVFELIQYLIENRERVVPRAELQKLLWGARAITDNALNVRIRSARRLLGDTGHTQLVIRTVQGVGYRFVADVDISSIRLGPSISELVNPARTRTHSDPFGSQPSIAVLPFETFGDGSRAEILAQGLAHDVTTRLARSRTMFVIARATAFQFAGAPQDVRAIGAKLGVRYLVQGAIQVAARNMKITVALANTVTRQELWSEQFQRKIDDFMSVQEEITGIIAGALEFEVQREEVERSLLMPSSNLDAWSAYHRGLHYMYHFRSTDCELAERHFQRSIEMEPTVPRPYAGLSFVNFERVFLSFDRDHAGNLRKAFDYARQSLAVDPLDPMGHWALSRAYLLRGDLEASKESLLTALTLNPSYAIAQYSLGWVALQLGDKQLCLDRIDVARRLSPYDPLKFAMLGVSALSLALSGKTDEAVERSMQSTLQPHAHWGVLIWAALSHSIAGRRGRAKSFFSRVRAQVPGYDVDDFFTIFRFQQPEHIRLITKAFRDLKA